MTAPSRPDIELQKNHLKGQCHEIFASRFFSWIIFLQVPENNIRVMKKKHEAKNLVATLGLKDSFSHQKMYKFGIWSMFFLRVTVSLPLLCLLANLWFLRDSNSELAGTSKCATNLATYPSFELRERFSFFKRIYDDISMKVKTCQIKKTGLLSKLAAGGLYMIC